MNTFWLLLCSVFLQFDIDLMVIPMVFFGITVQKISSIDISLKRWWLSPSADFIFRVLPHLPSIVMRSFIAKVAIYEPDVWPTFRCVSFLFEIYIIIIIQYAAKLCFKEYTAQKYYSHDEKTLLILAGKHGLTWWCLWDWTNSNHHRFNRSIFLDSIM